MDERKKGRPDQSGLRYGLNARLPATELISYSLQHLTFFLANTAILPVVVGGYLGLDQIGLAGLVQRTFILCGAASVLQALWGHGFPMMEGPAGLWYGILITLAASAPTLGKPLAVLRTDIELGFIIAGLVCLLFGITGLVGKIVKIFSPLVNGVFLVLLSLQLSPALIKGMAGLTAGNEAVDLKNLAACAITVFLIMWITLKHKGFLQSVAVLVGAGAGWIIAVLLGISPEISRYGSRLSFVPDFFSWGMPTFDLGVVLTFVLAGLILFSNLVASIIGMCTLTGEPLTPKILNKGAAFTGVSDILAGVGSAIGFVPYASAIGFAAMTGVASRTPFVLGALLMTLLGIFPSVGVFFAAMPPAVGNAVMFVIFSMVLGIGIKEFSKVTLNNREQYIIGVSFLIGVGVMFLPRQVFDGLPPVFRYLLLNGLVDGVILCILLEHVVLNDNLNDSVVRLFRRR
jgi:xanthine/uracil permease